TNQTNAIQAIDNDIKCKRPPSRTTFSEHDPTIQPPKSPRPLKKPSSHLDFERSIDVIPATPKLLPSCEPVSQSSISSSEEEFQPPKSRFSMRKIKLTNADNLKKRAEIIPAS